MTLGQFREMVDTDLIAFFSLTELVARVTIEAGHGSIINITSSGPERVLDRYPLARTARQGGAAAVDMGLASERGRYGVGVRGRAGVLPDSLVRIHGRSGTGRVDRAAHRVERTAVSTSSMA